MTMFLCFVRVSPIGMHLSIKQIQRFKCNGDIITKRCDQNISIISCFQAEMESKTLKSNKTSSIKTSVSLRSNAAAFSSLFKVAVSSLSATALQNLSALVTNSQLSEQMSIISFPFKPFQKN